MSKTKQLIADMVLLTKRHGSFRVKGNTGIEFKKGRVRLFAGKHSFVMEIREKDVVGYYTESHVAPA